MGDKRLQFLPQKRCGTRHTVAPDVIHLKDKISDNSCDQNKLNIYSIFFEKGIDNYRCISYNKLTTERKTSLPSKTT